MSDGRKQPLIVMAAGGTGGHMFPAQSLAEHMLRAGWRVKLCTDARGARYTGGFPHTTEVEQIASASFSRGGVAAKALAPFRIFGGTLAATWRMWRDRPDVVIGFGGYPTIPSLTAAWILRLPRAVHEQNGVLGKVNRFFAKRVNAVACGTWPTDLPEGIEGYHVGNPVRAAVAEVGRRRIHTARRLSHVDPRYRRQPGRAHSERRSPACYCQPADGRVAQHTRRPSGAR